MEAGTVPRRAPEGGLWGASPALLRLASDAQLVKLTRSGSRGAFEAVYDRHQRPILKFCAHLLGDRYEAEDATQQIFLSAYDGIVTSDQPIQLRPWLFTIARNRCLTMLRSRREVAVAECAVGVSDGPASVVQQREDLRDLVFDLGQLPDEQRAALVMAELGAFTHDEIALALEVPREKVKALVFQARESLVATRDARETDCAEIRHQLSTLRGPALRKGHLRRHLHDCSGCREFRHQLRHQRPRLAALLPLTPVLMLRRALTGGRGGGAVSATAVKAGAVKGIVSAAVAVIGATSAVVVVHAVVHQHHRRPHGQLVAGATLPALGRHVRVADDDAVLAAMPVDAGAVVVTRAASGRGAAPARRRAYAGKTAFTGQRVHMWGTGITRRSTSVRPVTRVSVPPGTGKSSHERPIGPPPRPVAVPTSHDPAPPKSHDRHPRPTGDGGKGGTPAPPGGTGDGHGKDGGPGTGPKDGGPGTGPKDGGPGTGPKDGGPGTGPKDGGSGAGGRGSTPGSGAGAGGTGTGSASGDHSPRTGAGDHSPRTGSADRHRA